MAIGQFFDKQKASSYIKGFISYFLGWLTSMTLVVIIRILINFINKSS